MEPQDVATVFATLSLLAGAASVVLVVGLVAGRRLPALDRLTWWVRDHAFALGAGVALVSMLGSLYFSEIADWEPCRYCWIQRIAMYPIVVVLGVAAWRRDEDARPTAMILATVGLGFSTWHYLIQRNPDWAGESSCSLTAPCSGILTESFGFVTIPWMAGSGFVLILVLLVTGLVLRDDEDLPHTTEEVVAP